MGKNHFSESLGFPSSPCCQRQSHIFKGKSLQFSAIRFCANKRNQGRTGFSSPYAPVLRPNGNHRPWNLYGDMICRRWKNDCIRFIGSLARYHAGSASFFVCIWKQARLNGHRPAFHVKGAQKDGGPLGHHRLREICALPAPPLFPTPMYGKERANPCY